MVKRLPPRLRIRDAHEFVNIVRDKFKDKSEIYDAFLKVMNDFKAERISRSDVKSKVRVLFKGHKDLILGFNKFMPKDSKITFESDPTPLKKPDIKDAFRFLDKVKATFHDDEDVYTSLLEILLMFSDGKKTVPEVYNELSNGLFRNHHDLRVDLAYFFPRYNFNAIANGETAKLG